MKKLLGVLLIASFLSIVGVSTVSATAVGTACVTSATCDRDLSCVDLKCTLLALSQPINSLPTTGIPETGNELIDRIGLIGNWVFAIFLAISVIYIVLAAFEFVTGAGDPAKVSGARMKLIYAAVGIAIALLAGGIDDIVRSIIVAK